MKETHTATYVMGKVLGYRRQKWESNNKRYVGSLYNMYQ